MQHGQTVNRLSKSNSPYLLQHAFNPVDWHEWGMEALQLAKDQNRLIFLSIGYSTCHWCHVMERESFEDEEVALLINSAFVAIKVDREQRPDIDQIYMDVCQAITGSGGWPLTLILTPEQEPVFAGTYFSKRQKYGRPGLMEILAAIHATWKTDPEKLIAGAKKVSHYFKNRPPSAIRFPEQKLVDQTVLAITADYDPVYGGFSSAPKFPMGHILELLLNYACDVSHRQMLAQVEYTLLSMYQGGLFDHLGGGFCRYSTDERWLIPHFEKMLYDNALLLRVYCKAFKVTENLFYKNVSDQICNYLLRDLRHTRGGFFAAEDADSEGHEGKFYVFTYEEFVALAGATMGEHLARFYGITPAGNFENGQNILHLSCSPEEFCQKHGLNFERFSQELARVQTALFALRAQRIRPSLDDKIITSWNGLIIGALASAGRLLGRASLIEAAQQAAEFVRENLCRPDGQLFRCWRNGKAEINGFFEDYAFLAHGLLELYRSDYNPGWLKWAVELHRQAAGLFASGTPGVYYETPENGEKLLFRPRNSFDGAIPSARAYYAENCVVLAAITGNSDFSDMATAIFAEAADLMHRAPSATAVMANAMRRFYTLPPRIVVFADKLADVEEFLAEIESSSSIDAVVVVCVHESQKCFYEELMADAGFLAASRKPVIQICTKDGCLAPVYDRESLKSVLLQL